MKVAYLRWLVSIGLLVRVFLKVDWSVGLLLVGTFLYIESDSWLEQLKQRKSKKYWDEFRETVEQDAKRMKKFSDRVEQEINQESKR
jgi:hypothetical protein